MFWTYLEESAILNSQANCQEDIRKSVSGAMEIMQGLPRQLKYTFAEHVSKLGHSAASSPHSSVDAIHYFKMVLNAIESTLIGTDDPLLQESDEGAAEKNPTKKLLEVMEMRLKAQLALAFVYNETG